MGFFCWVQVVVVIFVGFCRVGALCQGDGAVSIVTLKQAPATVHYDDSGDMRRLERDNGGKERSITPNKPRRIFVEVIDCMDNGELSWEWSSS